MTREELCGPAVIAVHHFLSAEECERLIARSERAGYRAADTGAPARAAAEDAELARALWERLAPLLPPEAGPDRSAALHAQFRFDRFDPGQGLAPHADEGGARAEHEPDGFGLLVYLNDDFEGGETTFYRVDSVVAVAPRRGTAVVFRHGQVREAAPVRRGRKYVARADVVRRRVPASPAGGG